MGVDFKQEDDGSVSLWNNIPGYRAGRVGGPGTPSQGTPAYHLPTTVVLPLTASNSSIGGSVLSWQNPYPRVMIVDRVVVNVTTGSSVAGFIDVGVSSVATGKNDTLIDACAVASATIKDNINDAGTNGKARQRVPVGYYINAAKSSGTVGGAMVANAYVTVYPV